MKWGAEADAKLLLGILKVHAIKIDYNALAKEMGNECTAKAITHRIANLKKAAANAEPSSSAPATPRKRGAPKSASDGGPTPKSARKLAPKKAIKRESTPDSLVSDGGEDDSIPPAKRFAPRRGAKPLVNYAEAGSESADEAEDVEDTSETADGAQAAGAVDGDAGDKSEDLVEGAGVAVKQEITDSENEGDAENQLLGEALSSQSV